MCLDMHLDGFAHLMKCFEYFFPDRPGIFARRAVRDERIVHRDPGDMSVRQQLADIIFRQQPATFRVEQPLGELFSVAFRQPQMTNVGVTIDAHDHAKVKPILCHRYQPDFGIC
jgi:hypothetical protein